MKKTIKILCTVMTILLLVSMAEALSVSPSVVKLSIAPGESKNGSFEIYNREKGEVFVEIFLQDWILDNNERKFSKPGTNPRSLNDWIILDQDEFLIPPETRKIIRYTIDVPEDAKGGHWGLVCFKSRPLKGERRSGIRLITQVISFVAVEVEGTVKKKLKIQEVLAEHKEVPLEEEDKTIKQIRLKAKLKNLGNVPLFSPSPIGKFKVKDKNNKVVAKGKLSGNMILPNEVSEYISEAFTLDKGEYETIVTFDYGMPKLVGKKVILPTDTLYNWKPLKKVAKKKLAKKKVK